MGKPRIIARLDVKGVNLIKGVHLEGLRVVGSPEAHASQYYGQGIDEIIYMDAVASLYGRNNLMNVVETTTRNVFVPLTVGGGLRSVDDVHDVLRAGADKVAINTAATIRPQLISEVAARFGSQCMVLSIEAKSAGSGKWEVFTDNGRESTGRDVVEWAREAVTLGAGEILLTSVDREGTMKGFDFDLVEALSREVPVPVIASGGAGSPAHCVEAFDRGADAVALASILHFKKCGVADVRLAAQQAGIAVRCYEQPMALDVAHV
jgi:imidazole glycerol-phosphate synthase subunit HisF